MLHRVYKDRGIRIRNHCGAEPPRDIESPGLFRTVGGRDRAPASYAAADRVQAPESTARRGFRGIYGGRTAAALQAEAGTVSGGGCLAGSLPPVLVRTRRRSRTPPRPHGSSNANEKEDKEDGAAQTADVTTEKRNENQTDQRVRGRPGQGPALLYGSTWLCQESRFQSGPISLADRGLARG